MIMCILQLMQLRQRKLSNLLEVTEQGPVWVRSPPPAPPHFWQPEGRSLRSSPPASLTCLNVGMNTRGACKMPEAWPVTLHPRPISSVSEAVGPGHLLCVLGLCFFFLSNFLLVYFQYYFVWFQVYSIVVRQSQSLQRVFPPVFPVPTWHRAWLLQHSRRLEASGVVSVCSRVWKPPS